MSPVNVVISFNTYFLNAYVPSSILGTSDTSSGQMDPKKGSAFIKLTLQ